MDIRHVQTFVAVLDEGGFAAAGRRLGLSRATITERLQALERDVGGLLLIRSPLMLTEAGLAFESHARRVIEEVSAALDAVASPQLAERGPLWVGLMAGGAAELNPVLFTALRRAMPDCRIVTVALPLADTERALVTGRVDVAILRSPVDQASLRSVQLFLAPRAALVARRGPFGDAESVSITDLGDIAVTGISTTHSSAFIDFFSLGPDRNGQALPVEFVDSYTKAAEAILTGRAVAVPSSDAARLMTLPPGLRFVPLVDAMASGAVAVCRRHDRRRIVTTFMQVSARVARASTGVVAESIELGGLSTRGAPSNRGLARWSGCRDESAIDDEVGSGRVAGAIARE